MRAEREPGEEAEQHRPTEVDREGAERKRPADPLGHRTVELESRHRAGPAEQHHADPDRDDGHRRTLTRRVNAVAT